MEDLISGIGATIINLAEKPAPAPVKNDIHNVEFTCDVLSEFARRKGYLRKNFAMPVPEKEVPRL